LQLSFINSRSASQCLHGHHIHTNKNLSSYVKIATALQIHGVLCQAEDALQGDSLENYLPGVSFQEEDVLKDELIPTKSNFMANAGPRDN
jgi:hypothetical protein